MTTATQKGTTTLVNAFLNEIKHEAVTTRKMLERLPEDKYDWKPHPKSMTLIRLATHIAELPGWVTLALTTEGLDFEKHPYKQELLKNNKELQASFEKEYKQGIEDLEKATDSDLLPDWTLRHGEQIFMKQSKGDTIRHCISQTIHHRAQLGVYLRLLDIPIPGSYGPSADEQ